MEVNYEKLLFSGTDEKTGNSFDLMIKISEITGIHLEYDPTFMRIEDHSLGIFHFVPLRIDFLKEGKEESIYVFANYSSLIRHSDNQKLFDELNAIRALAIYNLYNAKQQCIKVSIFTDEAPYIINSCVGSNFVNAK